MLLRTSRMSMARHKIADLELKNSCWARRFNFLNIKNMEVKNA
ncbi:Hypothetical cytosolic protein [Lactobacillus helveticus H10]|nr:Hypothetical cytosolic protein [Lactobacillus helveticus H10]